MVTNPFRRSVKADTKRTGGKGGRGNFFEKFRFPVDVATPILLINAEYVDPNPAPEEVEVDAATGRPKDVKKPYFKVRKHKRKMLKNGKDYYLDAVCSAGYNAHNPQPCAGCSATDGGDKTVTAADVFAVGIIHLAYYHKHPLIDRKTGGVVMKREASAGAVMVDSECTGRTCNFCRLLQGHPPIQDSQNPFPPYRREDIQTFFGKRRFMELGKNHLQDLMGWDATISATCGNDGSQLITDGFACPTCNALVIDMQNDPRTDEEINNAVASPYPCLQCQRPVMLRQVVACEVCEGAQREPKQFSVFDLVLHGMRQGEGTSSHMVLQRFETVEQITTRLLTQNPQVFAGKPPAQYLAEIGKPYDFAETYKPLAVHEQALRLELAAPPMASPGYGQQPYPQAPPYGSQPTQQQAPFVPGVPPQMTPAGAPANPQPPAFVPPSRPPFSR
jgi:hypothetical protein